jgi:hypothetical protein
VITAVLADLQRFFEVGLEERRIALVTLDEDAARLNAPLLRRYGFGLLLLFTKPRQRFPSFTHALKSAPTKVTTGTPRVA